MFPRMTWPTGFEIVRVLNKVFFKVNLYFVHIYFQIFCSPFLHLIIPQPWYHNASDLDLTYIYIYIYIYKDKVF